MARLHFSRRASKDLGRLAEFLWTEFPAEADKTAALIADGLQTLKLHPRIGRVRGDGVRELVISRGKTGYVALYRYDEIRDTARVLAIRHQRELGNA
jgi:plasmid stabilization system protein ParE